MINLEFRYNNSTQFIIIYVLSQQLQGQLETQHNIGPGNHVKDQHNIKTEANYRQALKKENTLIQKKWGNRNKDEEKYTENVITKKES
jgi:hypothetical protein